MIAVEAPEVVSTKTVRMVFPGATAEIRNIHAKLYVVVFVGPVNNIVDLYVVFGIEEISLSTTPGKCPVYDILLRIDHTTCRVMILFVKELQLIQNGRRDNPSIVKDHIIFARLRVHSSFSEDEAATVQA